MGLNKDTIYHLIEKNAVETGESYDQIRQNLEKQGIIISKTTVANCLKNMKSQDPQKYMKYILKKGEKKGFSTKSKKKGGSGITNEILDEEYKTRVYETVNMAVETGLSTRKLAKRLLEEKGIKISHVTVYKYLTDAFQKISPKKYEDLYPVLKKYHKPDDEKMKIKLRMSEAYELLLEGKTVEQIAIILRARPATIYNDLRVKYPKLNDDAIDETLEAIDLQLTTNSSRNAYFHKQVKLEKIPNRMDLITKIENNELETENYSYLVAEYIRQTQKISNPKNRGKIKTRCLEIFRTNLYYYALDFNATLEQVSRATNRLPENVYEHLTNEDFVCKIFGVDFFQESKNALEKSLNNEKITRTSKGR